MTSNIIDIEKPANVQAKETQAKKSSGNDPTKEPKNIVLCSDGTGNSGGKINGTNVWKIFECVDRYGHLLDPFPKKQIAFHDDGVGTQRFKLLKLVTGACGWGLSANIRELYTFLVKNYHPGDQIYLFGFSRGAFTVRSLAGMIHTCGIVDKKKVQLTKELDGKVQEAFRIYKDYGESARSQEFRNTWSVKAENATRDDRVKIRFVGVWDTVCAIGVPVDQIREWLLWPWTKFHKIDLNGSIENAYHALSIDDERRTFHPEMWAKGETSQVVEQVWFAGVHSNVGGGYPREEQSLVALDWMMAKAEKCGLRFETERRAAVQRDANVHGRMYDSRSGLMAYYRYKPRMIAEICEKADAGEPKIHLSVFERINRVTADYAPGTFPADFEVVTTERPDPQSPKDKELAGKMSRLAQGIHDRLTAPEHDPCPGLQAAKPLIFGRKCMYFVLLAWTGMTLALAMLAQSERLSIESGGEMDGGWLADLGAGLVSSFVPGFLENLYSSLTGYPLVTAVVLASLAGLIWLRRRFERLYKYACLDAWRLALPLPMSGTGPTRIKAVDKQFHPTQGMG